MPESSQLLTTSVIPTGVLGLAQAALQQDLLEDAESLVRGLERAGWRRDTHGGWWTCEEDPAWTLGSSLDPADISVFATGPNDVVAEAAEQLVSHLTGGGVQGLGDGETDDLGVRTWHAPAAGVELYFSPSRIVDLGHKSIEMPCTLQLGIARPDAPTERRPVDYERSRRVAREGSALRRWYLAAQQDLPDDVVQALALDGDPAVVAALQAGARQREHWRERVATGVEDA